MAASMSLSKAATKPVAKAAKSVAAKPAGKVRAAPAVEAAPKVAAKVAKGGSKLGKSLQEASAVGSFDGVSNDALQQILAAAVHAYAARIEDGAEMSPFPARRHVTATDVMLTCTSMLKAVGLQLFELGMWQAWSGRH